MFAITMAISLLLLAGFGRLIFKAELRRKSEQKQKSIQAEGFSRDKQPIVLKVTVRYQAKPELSAATERPSKLIKRTVREQFAQFCSELDCAEIVKDLPFAQSRIDQALRTELGPIGIRVMATHIDYLAQAAAAVVPDTISLLPLITPKDETHG